MILEADIGVMQIQAKECQETLGAGKGKGAFSPRAVRESMVLPIS